mmetsp:Transcript_109619/g.261426  ORF Transcript_109619/g.261426 Transcript_109619/m.261426 type:complete len:215 (-) Transcript_109619:38-682(-)
MAQFFAYEATFIAVKSPASAPGLLRARSAESFRRVEQRDTVHGYVSDLQSRALRCDFLKVPLPPQPEAGENAGSVGHPEFCRKPCIFALAGNRCFHSASCNFCHKDHDKHTKLGRRQRELLQQLGEADRLALILPFLRAKELQEADGLLSRLETRLFSLTSARAAAPSWQIVQLRRNLGHLSFRHLLLLWPSAAQLELALRELQELQALVAGNV